MKNIWASSSCQTALAKFQNLGVSCSYAATFPWVFEK